MGDPFQIITLIENEVGEHVFQMEEWVVIGTAYWS